MVIKKFAQTIGEQNNVVLAALTLLSTSFLSKDLYKSFIDEKTIIEK